jgi:hypothetical protein
MHHHSPPIVGSSALQPFQTPYMKRRALTEGAKLAANARQSIMNEGNAVMTPQAELKSLRSSSVHGYFTYWCPDDDTRHNVRARHNVLIAPSGAPEVEITDAMIAAGVAALCHFDPCFQSQEDGVVSIFRAMLMAQAEARCSSLSSTEAIEHIECQAPAAS